MKTIESDNLSTSHKNLVKKQFIDATDHKEIWFDPHPKPEARWSGTRLVKTSLTTAIRYWAAVLCIPNEYFSAVIRLGFFKKIHSIVK